MLVTLLTLMKVYIIYGFSLPSVQSILHAFARGSVRMMPLGKIWEFVLYSEMQRSGSSHGSD